jgi:hypothetical protein
MYDPVILETEKRMNRDGVSQKARKATKESVGKATTEAQRIQRPAWLKRLGFARAGILCCPYLRTFS